MSKDIQIVVDTMECVDGTWRLVLHFGGRTWELVNKVFTNETEAEFEREEVFEYLQNVEANPSDLFEIFSLTMKPN